AKSNLSGISDIATPILSALALRRFQRHALRTRLSANFACIHSQNMSTASSSKKRAASQLDGGEGPTSNKVPKVHPFFSKTKSPAVADLSGPLKWLTPLGTIGSCLHATHLEPTPSARIAAFDLDGTVIASLPFSAPPLQWHWWNKCVPAKLTQVAEEGYSIVLISNQGGLKSASKANKWKEKLGLIAAAIPDVPFRLFAATAKDRFRKPMIGMWEELERLYTADGVQIDKEGSFFVGDAAGRVHPNGKKKDFASTDRKWALNVEIQFYTPEEYFLSQTPDTQFALHGFSVSSLPSALPLFAPSSTPLLPDNPTQELVLFVGYPCLGKTTLFRKHFEPAGYIHINQDVLKTREKCVKAVDTALAEGKKCVVDNTNRDASTRKYYIDAAKKRGVPVRCMVFTGSYDLAWHNNLYRAYGLPASVISREPARELLPIGAFTTFRDKFEEPDLSEGFAHIISINWTFEGTDDEKKAWSRWLQLDDPKK
ncbi:unnamed protein product, partial [Mycena citricolor]